MNQSQTNSSEIILYPGKLKHLLLGFVSICFVAIGIFMVLNGEWMGYLIALFFGLGLPVSILSMIPKASYLKLYDSGFEFSTMYRRTSVNWNDITEFGVLTQKRSLITIQKLVGWNYAPNYQEFEVGRKISKSISNLEGALPDTYGMKAEELMDLMIEYWEKDRNNAEHS